MALATGTRLGAYEITEQIGVGGMGEVYRASDKNLKRDVAIKVLPEAFVEDADRLARFQREAEVLASLNHANIATIHGLEKADGQTVIVMELVEGPTLADRIKEGPIPPDEALGIARQVADALEAAHGRQIVHRDLKPANIKLRPDGTVKVLDFGISKPIDARTISGGQSPAMTTPAVTETGVILGTAAYMSPEQARGRPVDERTDIWAFGCLLFEMLTGQPAFGGEDVMATLARVIDRDTDLSSMPGTISAAVRHTIKLCLEKDPQKRIADIRDVRLALQGRFESPLPQVVRVAARQPFWRRSLPLAGGAFASGALVVGVVVWLALQPASRPVNRFAYTIPENQPYRRTGRNVMAFSPNGRHFVYNTNQGLYLREMGEIQARLIPGTEEDLANPFFSPDGQSVAYWSAGDDALKRIAISGGPPVVITDDVQIPNGATWTRDDLILFVQEQGIFRVPASGGQPELVVAPQAGEILSGPELLPDGDTVLFSVSSSGLTWDEAQIVAQSITGGQRTVLIQGGGDAHYLRTGHLVYALNDGLFGVSFDVSALTTSGGAVPLVQGVLRAGGTDSANYGMADDGTLVYLMGSAVSRRKLVWVDREGREEPINAPARNYMSAQLSPDDARIALDIRERENDIWILDVNRATLQRLTFDPGFNVGPTWTPDGQRVAFSGSFDNANGLYWQAADGSGVPERLIESELALVPSEFLPDGSALLYTEVPPMDIWIGPTEAPSAGSVLLQTPAIETNASISPDGDWIAFQSDESGQNEVYVRPFPDVETGRWQISTGGGTRPRWSRDGTELFYYLQRTDGSGAVMAVPIESGPTFTPGIPKLLLEGPYVAPHPGRQTFDVSADGQRFLMIGSTGADAEQRQIIVVENWLGAVQRLVRAE